MGIIHWLDPDGNFGHGGLLRLVDAYAWARVYAREVTGRVCEVVRYATES